MKMRIKGFNPAIFSYVYGCLCGRGCYSLYPLFINDEGVLDIDFLSIKENCCELNDMLEPWMTLFTFKKNTLKKLLYKDDFQTLLEKEPKFYSYEKNLYLDKSIIQGKGLFTNCKIPRGAKIIEFKGFHLLNERLNGEIKKQELKYILHLNNFGIMPEGLIKYANHSCDPNMIMYRMWLYAKRDIEKDEELTFSYFDYRYKTCKCSLCKEIKHART